MPFNETFLHFIWKYRLFNQKKLFTTDGAWIEIITTGLHNTHAGADFENAKIRIGDTVWAGNVEIHLKTSDWDKHNHTADKAYNNVILHVVYEHDKPVYRNDGSSMNTLALKAHIFPNIESRYHDLMANLSWIPCENLLNNVDNIHLENWLLRILIERMEEKSQQVIQLLEQCKGSWDDVFYILLARNFGFKTNALPFELLAKSLPQQVLAKHKNNPQQIEALVFGQAGFLSHAVDQYTKSLREEYIFLQQKFQLQPVEQHLWKFLRLRPQNFPTIRLAQFAALIVKSSHLFSKIIEVSDTKSITTLFKELPVNTYWETHYRFGKAVKQSSCKLGNESINNLILNTIVLTLFSYGKYTGNQLLTDKAIELLESLPTETNHIIERFKQSGIPSVNAGRSQALLQLKKYYCDKKNCLNCAIGAKILNVA